MPTEVHNLKRLRISLSAGTLPDFTAMTSLPEDYGVTKTDHGYIVTVAEDSVKKFTSLFGSDKYTFTEKFQCRMMFVLGWVIGKRYAEIEFSSKEPVCAISGNITFKLPVAKEV
jgi:hypothetical protein